MLKDYQDRLQQVRQAHPISQADLEAWRLNPLTIQLFEDLELLPIVIAESITANDAATAGLQSAKLNGVQDTAEYAIDWAPEYLITKKEDN